MSLKLVTVANYNDGNLVYWKNKQQQILFNNFPKNSKLEYLHAFDSYN